MTKRNGIQHFSVYKKSRHLSLNVFCNKAWTCSGHCKYKNSIKVATRDAKIVCPYSYELNDVIIVEQLKLFPTTDD